MQDDSVDRLRKICLAYPEASEQGEIGDPPFKVRNKIFAMGSSRDGRPAVWCKAPPGAQAVLVQAEPEHYFIPPYVGRYGWIAAWLDREVDWEIVADLIDTSYRMTAPKRLLAQLESR
ncbi:MmcQ/YjbR family DNA-binding protein [Ktedonosporobacter rubrisoli]|uniref:MmcQ/YjbR family DNA-binding protein n=1 Tax=Ktedonosporobacter rubrisoli TaxID=2509675 RepID=A0A4P6JKH7_KTERU|nr:MmcQ/YjbR family DNA-binding protein [Ktedonosporobacter rubrisoli]QBD75655.1 MmcQ/YjbR family DNA-binding protein [Ktedonosporobacter rubrisoli]